MTKNIIQVLPSSAISRAIAYSMKCWTDLQAYLYDGSLEIDNNRVENSIRPNALGRKNYLFAGSHEAAQNAAMFYSFFGTCKKHNIEPLQWLTKVREIIPDYKENKLEDLLPQNFKVD